MKKQLFTLIALLAMVLVGSNAMAQLPTDNSGLTPAEARLAVVGSTSMFAVTEAGQAATYDWDVFEILATAAHDVADPNATEIGTGCQLLEADGDVTAVNTTATVYFRWLTNAAAGNIYCVQVTSTSTVAGSGNATCSTIRRFFVAVFDYDVTVYLSSALGVADEEQDPGFDIADINDVCNSWSDRVIKNGTDADLFEGTDLTDPEGWAETDNGRAVAAGGLEKTTQTYFTVRMELTGAPANFDLDELPWRFRFSMPDAANLSLLEINLTRQSIAGSVADFGSEGGGTAITGAEVLALSAVAGWDNNNTVYVAPLGRAVATVSPIAEYTFMVRSHNNLGADDMDYNILIDEINLDLQNNDAYNDGVKFGDATVHVAPELAVSKGQSEIRQVKMSPATSTIVITD